jgi:uncharacterized protein (TIGR00730 family)
MMPKVYRLCVYCGSSPGSDPQYGAAARQLGEAMARHGIELVFGGGRIGLMGILADAVLAHGGRVTGIIPKLLRTAEVAHAGVTELVIVDSMHERKRVMAERADAFAILPGGIGTLDEAFEIITWRQLRLHDKPIFIVDIGGYWRPLCDLLDHIAANGFVTPIMPRLSQVVPDILALIDAVERAGTTPAAAPRLQVS